MGPLWSTFDLYDLNAAVWSWKVIKDVPVWKDLHVDATRKAQLAAKPCSIGVRTADMIALITTWLCYEHTHE